MEEIWQWVLLGAGSVLAGVVNTVAGGGSMLTVPLLVLVGLSPNSANATNRIGTITQAATASWTFHQQGVTALPLTLRLLPTGLAGAALGAYLATIVSDETFRVFFGLLMIPMALLFFVTPGRRWRGAEQDPKHRLVPLIGGFFFVGAFAGFVQAGYGLVALAVLVLLGGRDLVQSNAVKVLLSLVMAAISLAIFAGRIEIDLLAGLVLGAGSAIGGVLGGLAAVRRGEQWIRPMVLIMSLALAIKMIVG